MRGVNCNFLKQSCSGSAFFYSDTPPPSGRGEGAGVQCVKVLPSLRRRTLRARMCRELDEARVGTLVYPRGEAGRPLPSNRPGDSARFTAGSGGRDAVSSRAPTRSSSGMTPVSGVALADDGRVRRGLIARGLAIGDVARCGGGDGGDPVCF